MKKSKKFFLNNTPLKNTTPIHHKFPILISLSFVIFLCLAITLFTTDLFQHTSSSNISVKKTSDSVIVIDAGHGGSDPGKIGVAGTQEKNINLKIALYLKEILEAQDMKVLLTREKDEELSTDSSKRKISDMKERVSLIEKNKADIVVSIHQNSYTDPKIYGAQCFYYTPLEEGKTLAAILQEQIISSTNQTKIREIKGNEDYYLLKHSKVPTVIVECGFLSNPKEEQLLLKEEYQRKMAWAIHLGIVKYLNRSA